jgi:TolB-like protein/Tfp pilus assembly protein PilF
VAKQGRGGVDDDLTQTLGGTIAGTVLGTPAYTSPEQAEGRPADARSDIFSFGAVFYEMLSGRRAFAGNSAAAVIGAIVHKEPEPLNAPPALVAIVQKCLAKSRDERYQTATELRKALESPVVPAVAAATFPWRSVAAAVGVSMVVIAGVVGAIYKMRPASGHIDSIAVLPLEIRSSDPDADYISDGITESINNSLAQLPDLKVIPLSVAQHYKGKSADFQKVGAELGVQGVLTGHITQRGDELSVGVELDDVSKGRQLWGQSYNRDVGDLLHVEGDIAREVSQRLRSQLSADDQKKVAAGSTENPEAYQIYLKGKYFTNKFTRDGFTKGLEYFNQAIAIDPNYGLAYTGIAYKYVNQDDWYIAPNDGEPSAKEAAMRALALNESDADAHVVLAIVKQWYDWDWPGAEKEFKRAIDLSPNDAEARGYYSWFLAQMGRNDEAVAQAKRGLEADPFLPLANFNAGAISVFLRQWDLAIEQLRSAKEMAPDYWFNMNFLGRAYEQAGKLPEAIAEFKAARAESR